MKLDRVKAGIWVFLGSPLRKICIVNRQIGVTIPNMWLSVTPTYWSRGTVRAQWAIWPLQRAEQFNGGIVITY